MQIEKVIAELQYQASKFPGVDVVVQDSESKDPELGPEKSGQVYIVHESIEGDDGIDYDEIVLRSWPY